MGGSAFLLGLNRSNTPDKGLEDVRGGVRVGGQCVSTWIESFKCLILTLDSELGTRREAILIELAYFDFFPAIGMPAGLLVLRLLGTE